MFDVEADQPKNVKDLNKRLRLIQAERDAMFLNHVYDGAPWENLTEERREELRKIAYDAGLKLEKDTWS